ncbi:MAG TPA: hypothetical protein VD794_09185 [Flavisolibacter sp.]|nr:hypothetical protein [Flavisolibacter sp.]
MRAAAYFIYSLIAINVSFGQPANNALPANELESRNRKWREDIQYFKERFPAYDKTYTPVLFSNHTDSNNLHYAIEQNNLEPFLRGVDSLYNAVNTLNDEQLMIGLCKLIALSPNAHTRLYLFRVRTVMNNLPLGIHWFDQDLHIIAAPPAYKQLLGAKIKAINDVSIDSVKKRVDALISGNTHWKKYMSLYFLRSPQALKGLGLGTDGDQLTLAVEPLHGKAKTVLMKADFVHQSATLEVWKDLSPVTVKKDSLAHLLGTDIKKLPLYLQHTDKAYSYQYLKDEGLVYLQFNRAVNSKEKTFSDLVREMVTAIKDQPFTKFVFDLRFNTGGSIEVSEKAIEMLAPYLRNKKSYVITGHSTFSAGIVPAGIFKKLTGAKVVGSPAGDALIFLSEGGNVVLPHSKLHAHYANGLLNWSIEKGFTIHPDKTITVSFSDYVKGEDTILNFILNEE